MTEFEFQQAKRTHDRMTRRSLWARLVVWVKALPQSFDSMARRARLDRKAEVERKARQTL